MILKDIIINKLENEKDTIREQWDSHSTTSTRHFYIDNFLPDDVASSIYDAFPKDGENFIRRKNFREQKSTSAHSIEKSSILGDITSVFHLSEVVSTISDIIGVPALEADPSLYAGGLSMMFNGDFLNPHIDNSHDGNRSRYRRLNLLYYISPDWVFENGGNFELWDDKVQKPKTFISKFNRLVAMETTDKSWHSVSRVIAKTPRCCVSNYYFSKISPNGSEYFHVTSFTGRPKDKLKRALGPIDNFLRNVVSKTLMTRRGKNIANK